MNFSTPVEELADALVRAQRDIEPAQARDIAARAASDDEVLATARQWIATGAWPAEPELEGWTPADIARLHRPSFVLTALLWLKQDPQAAKRALRHSTADPEVPYAPNVTTDPIAAGFFARNRDEDG